MCYNWQRNQIPWQWFVDCQWRYLLPVTQKGEKVIWDEEGLSHRWEFSSKGGNNVSTVNIKDTREWEHWQKGGKKRGTRIVCETSVYPAGSKYIGDLTYCKCKRREYFKKQERLSKSPYNQLSECCRWLIVHKWGGDSDSNSRLSWNSRQWRMSKWRLCLIWYCASTSKRTNKILRWVRRASLMRAVAQVPPDASNDEVLP